MFSEKLHILMQENGISQARLSALTGIPQSGIHRYLNGGMVPLEAAVKIAQATGVDVAWFLDSDSATPTIPDWPKMLEIVTRIAQTHGPEEVIRRLSSTPDHIPDVSKMVQPLEEQHLQAVPIPGLPGGDLEEQQVVGPMREEEPTKPRQGKRGSRKGTG